MRFLKTSTFFDLLERSFSLANIKKGPEMLLQANSFHVYNELSCCIYSNQESFQRKFPEYCFGEEFWREIPKMK